MLEMALGKTFLIQSRVSLGGFTTCESVTFYLPTMLFSYYLNEKKKKTPADQPFPIVEKSPDISQFF